MPDDATLLVSALSRQMRPNRRVTPMNVRSVFEQETTNQAIRLIVHSLFVVATFARIAAAESPAAKTSIEFNRDVRSFLSDTCFQCHGPDTKTREAGLRLDEEAAAKSDLGGYAAIVPGKPDASEAVRRIFSTDPEIQMPPPASKLSLTHEQKEIFRRWILEGAVYQEHWAFHPIRRPKLPDAMASHHPIDAWVQAKLTSVGLTPSPPAPPTTLIRRVTLDLTGLPPRSDEVDAFLSDIEARGIDKAYESVVDGLLKSPRFGERMAWPWMEAARYADTDGYQNDGHRDMWRWRDWVIDAFNSGMPFDQFTIEQLAGDLLPNPSHEQLIATAFNRNNRYNSEEGIPIDEFLLENAVDRVDTTATVWMGLTLGCARCHDHKFDPINQKEYYQLVDYFNDVAESGRAIKAGNSEPWIKTPVEEQRVKLAAFDSKIHQAEKALADASDRLAEHQAAWEKNGSKSDEVLKHGLDYYFAMEGSDERLKPSRGEPKFVAGVQGQAIQVGESGSLELGKIPGLIGNGRFSMAFWLKPLDEKDGPVFSNEMPGTGRNGILVEFVGGKLRWNINTRWISGVSTVETMNAFAPNEWAHVVLTNDGTQRAAGMLVYVNGIRQDIQVIRNTNSNVANRDLGAAMNLGYSKHVGTWNGLLDEIRFYTRRTLSDEEAQLLAVRESIQEIVALPWQQRSEVQNRLARIAYLEQSEFEDDRSLWDSLNNAREKRTAYWDSLPTTMIMQDLPNPRPSFVRLRGVYDAFGEPVSQGVPAVLPPLKNAESNNRLEFARWLVSREHPLTARVTANRFWQILFGVGLVKTTEDFGTQGELPSHPELLDWLASEFIESGWNVKGLFKTIVMSHTYRQSSDIHPQHRQVDPDNRWLARAPRMRLAGNVLRDQALYVSGLLVEKRGGPSVFPYQPDRLWEEASNAKYKMSRGDDLYRRSLYTYWKRTLAPPTMAVLDTADRESCSVKPKLTNTPLQALTLMNEVTFVEAARKFAERILNEGGDSDLNRIDFAFRQVTSRLPSEKEKEVLAKATADFRNAYNSDDDRAQAILRVGASKHNDNLPEVELATMTALANLLLNLDEVTTRE